MAIRVNVPRDLSRVKEKVAFNLTKRQLICFTLAGMIGVPTFFLVKSVSDTIDIYVLTWGISQNDYSLGTAAGIFKSVVSITIILIANTIAKRRGGERLF